MEIRGRTLIITGGGGGIGGAAAVLLAKSGASLILVDRDETAAGQVLTRLEQGDHRFIEADVASIDRAAEIFELITREKRDFAGVINAAGIVSGGSPWPASDLERMRTVINVNAVGTVIFSTLATRHNGTGERVIVNVASAAAIRPHPPDPAYATSKAGVVAFTRSAAAAGLEGLRINAVLPGVVRTRMLDTTGVDGVAPWLAPRLHKPLLTSEQVAETILELVTGDHHGQTWSVELDDNEPDHVKRTAL